VQTFHLVYNAHTILQAEHGLRCVRLPIAEHAAQLGLVSEPGVNLRPVLNVSDVVIALLLRYNGADWASALQQAIPQRKRRPTGAAGTKRKKRVRATRFENGPHTAASRAC
jgi:hypothetical protein